MGDRPRSFRRLWPALGWIGPLAFSRPAHAFAAQCDAILAADDAMADDFAQITIPTLVLVGNQDILTPRGDSEDLADRIPTAELVVISGAAHGFMVEHATTFNRVLLEFLGRAGGLVPRAVPEPASPDGGRGKLTGCASSSSGPGLAGLTAARSLAAGGHEVVVSTRGVRREAGWRPGGSVRRRSTTAPSSSPCARRVRRQVDDVGGRGLVRVWATGSPDGDGYPRYIGTRWHERRSPRTWPAGSTSVSGAGVHAPPPAVAARMGSRRRRRHGPPRRSGDRAVPAPQAFGLLADAGLDLQSQLLRCRLRPHHLPDGGARPAGGGLGVGWCTARRRYV